MRESLKKTFNHIKVHTQFSICEGAVKINELQDFCKKNKITSVAVSDTQNLSGALEFSELLSSVGTQPIIGTLLLFKFKNYFGLIPLIAKNIEGYKNIIELSSKSYLENNSLSAIHTYNWHMFNLLAENLNFFISSKLDLSFPTTTNPIIPIFL